MYPWFAEKHSSKICVMARDGSTSPEKTKQEENQKNRIIWRAAEQRAHTRCVDKEDKSILYAYIQ